VIICIIRGTWVAEIYWDWKNLTNAISFLLLPICIYIFSHPALLQKILSNWVTFAIPVFAFITFTIPIGAYGFYLAPLILFLLY
jgi:hypothetical protein